MMAGSLCGGECPHAFSPATVSGSGLWAMRRDVGVSLPVAVLPGGADGRSKGEERAANGQEREEGAGDVIGVGADLGDGVRVHVFLSAGRIPRGNSHNMRKGP